MLNADASQMNLPRLILASASPRRREILTAVGWDFQQQTADIDETDLPGENAANYVRRLAKEKAFAVAQTHQNALVLGADTIVVIDAQIVGKPKDFADARRMLQMLSGRWHEVLTGIALVKVTAGIYETKVDLQKTRVKFAELSGAEIEFLVENGAPLDKAGAYAVQAQAALFIERIEGDYWNVVGLPVNLVYELVFGKNAKEKS